MSHAAQPDHFLCWNIQLEQIEHLAIAVLVHHVDPLVRSDEVVHFAGEWVGPQPQIIDFDAVVALQLVQRFN